MNRRALPGYEQSRDLIQNGDVVFVKKGTSIWSKLTQFVTSSKVYHCGVAFWVRDPNFAPRLMLLETHKGGRRIVSLSSYAKHPMDVIAAPIPWVGNCDAFLETTGAIDYSITDYIAVGLWELFRIRVNVGRNAEVCSKLVAKYLNQDPSMELEVEVSPGTLFDDLLMLGYEVRCRIYPPTKTVQPSA